MFFVFCLDRLLNIFYTYHNIHSQIYQKLQTYKLTTVAISVNKDSIVHIIFHRSNKIYHKLKQTAHFLYYFINIIMYLELRRRLYESACFVT